MWVALLVVAPVVIAGARSVRRGEVDRQVLPVHLRDEGGVLDSGDQMFAGTRWGRDQRGHRFLDLSLAPGPGLLIEPDVLAYWNPVAAQADAEEITALPANVVLLGALGTGAVHRFELSDGVRENAGSLVLFSAAHQHGFLIRMPESEDSLR